MTHFFSQPLRIPCLLFLMSLFFVVPASMAQTDAPVRVMALPDVIQQPEHLFPWNGKTLRFMPKDQKGGYRVRIVPTAVLLPTPNHLSASDLSKRRGKQTLSFPFPFGGKSHTELFVNRSGNLSFGKSEDKVTAERNPWASGGMRSMAAVLNERSLAGQESMIAALWAVNDAREERGQVSVGGAAGRFFAVTWHVQSVPWGQEVAGRDVFQARLFPDGVIELVYASVSRQDGIVGLFTGTAPVGKRLEQVGSTGDVASTVVEDVGSALKFSFTFRRDIVPPLLPANAASVQLLLNDGPLSLRAWIDSTDHLSCYTVTDADPRTLGCCVEGTNTLAVFVSKLRLLHPSALTWAASASSNTVLVPENRAHALRRINSAPALAENLFDVYHYPSVAKDPLTLLTSVYRQVPPSDDIALVFTDFRIDDLFAQGPSTGGLNVPIHGLGPRAEHPESTAERGFTRLQVAPATVWIGAPFLAERGWDEQGTAFFRFGRGVAWLAHEITHRWGPELRFRNPRTGKEEPLTTASPHWFTDLYAPAFASLPTSFLSGAPNGLSLMSEGGSKEWRENPDGTFQFRRYVYWTGIGYSALDLYVMGFLPPEAVPDTFLMQDIQPVAAQTAKPQDGWSPPVTATRVPVRMADILAVMGRRVPDAVHSQKEFRLGVYLVHPPGREVDAFALERATRLSRALAGYFQTATGGRMKIVFSNDASFASARGI